MKEYKILGSRVLLRVNKILKTFEKEGVIQRIDSVLDQDTATQTVGIVEQLGPTVHEFEDFRDLKPGVKVHFQRYGAQRLDIKDNEEFERWVINAKDVLVIECE